MSTSCVHHVCKQCWVRPVIHRVATHFNWSENSKITRLHKMDGGFYGIQTQQACCVRVLYQSHPLSFTGFFIDFLLLSQWKNLVSWASVWPSGLRLCSDRHQSSVMAPATTSKRDKTHRIIKFNLAQPATIQPNRETHCWPNKHMYIPGRLHFKSLWFRNLISLHKRVAIILLGSLLIPWQQMIACSVYLVCLLEEL